MGQRANNLGKAPYITILFFKDFLNIPLFTIKTVLEFNLLAVNVDYLIASLLW